MVGGQLRQIIDRPRAHRYGNRVASAQRLFNPLKERVLRVQPLGFQNQWFVARVGGPA